MTALQLRDKYTVELSDDDSVRFECSDRASSEALKVIKPILTLNGFNLAHFGLTDPGNALNDLAINFKYFGRTIEEISHTMDDTIVCMNPHQLKAFHILYTMVTSTCMTQTHFDLDSTADCGKLFVSIVHCLKLQRLNRVPEITETPALGVKRHGRG